MSNVIKFDKIKARKAPKESSTDIERLKFILKTVEDVIKELEEMISCPECGKEICKVCDTCPKCFTDL